MNKMVRLNNQLACANCGNEAKETYKKCGYCHQPFDEKLKVFDTRKPNFQRRKLTREDIVRKKVRNNEPLVIADFISVHKLKELKRVSIMI